jgi:hypothetical protein
VAWHVLRDSERIYSVSAIICLHCFIARDHKESRERRGEQEPNLSTGWAEARSTYYSVQLFTVERAEKHKVGVPLPQKTLVLYIPHRKERGGGKEGIQKLAGKIG